MSDGAWFSLPTGRKLPDAPDRPVALFGVLRPATDELRAALRKHGAREIPENKVTRHEGGRYWTDTVTGEELELVRSSVDPTSPDEARCVAFVTRGGYVVPLKRRGDEGQVTRKVIGVMGGRQAEPHDPMPVGPEIF